MAWARVDDGFDDHPKVLALLEEEQGVAAVGLWTLCLTWAHRNTRRRGKTPGLLPAGLPRRYLGSSGREVVKLLVAHDLWDEVAAGGWMIHDFDQYLPTEETKAARSAAGKKGAAKRWGSKKSANDDQSDPKQTDGNLLSASHVEPSGGDEEAMPADAVGNDEGVQNGLSGVIGQDATPSPTEGAGAADQGVFPGADSKLPSASHSPDSNTVASDGSRAPAHRAIPNGIAPTPLPVPEKLPLPSEAGADKPRRQSAKASPDQARPLSVTQRAKRITDAYSEAEPLCKWPAVNAIVIRAIKAQKWADEEVRDALLRLAKDNRSVTVDSLRNELTGPPKGKYGEGSGSEVPERDDYDPEKFV